MRIMAAMTGWILLLGVLAMPALGASTPPDRPALEAYFREGSTEFAAGLDIAAGDPAAARERFAKAAAAWRTIVTDGGIRNADLERNIGNASLLAGDAPRAIAAFRRAGAIEPRDRAVLDGLAAARRAAGTEAYAPDAARTSDSGGSQGGWRDAMESLGRFVGWTLGQLAAVFPPRWLLWAAAACYMATAGLALLRLRGIRQVRRWMPWATLAAAALTAMPLVAADLRRWRQPEAVVVAAGTTARQGPAEMYEPSFKEPLTAGLEVIIVEERGEWVLVRLHDGRTAWVRSGVLERL
jgi:hypothetical protein